MEFDAFVVRDQGPGNREQPNGKGQIKRTA